MKTSALLIVLFAIATLGCDTDSVIDDDGDGWSPPADCDDARADVYPGRDEIPYDGVDQDCSGSDLVDRDGDAFNGDEDCDDLRADVRPTGVDVCGDGVDQDCSGEDLACTDADRDRDGFSPNEGDCNDDDARINPRAREIPYDGVDQDCDLETPDDDLDGDGFGIRSDCDDEDPRVYPGALDPVGDGIDADCDGHDADADYDRDGHLAEPEGDDCDDFDPYVNPSRVDVPGDGLDADCDGADDLGSTVLVENLRSVVAYDGRVAIVTVGPFSEELVWVDVVTREIFRRDAISPVPSVAVGDGSAILAVRESSRIRLERWREETVDVLGHVPVASSNPGSSVHACGAQTWVVVRDQPAIILLRVNDAGATRMPELPISTFRHVGCAGEGLVFLDRNAVLWLDADGSTTFRELTVALGELLVADEETVWATTTSIVRIPRGGGSLTAFPYRPIRWVGLLEIAYFDSARVAWQARLVPNDERGVLEERDRRPVLGPRDSSNTFSDRRGHWLAWRGDELYVPRPYTP